MPGSARNMNSHTILENSFLALAGTLALSIVIVLALSDVPVSSWLLVMTPVAMFGVGIVSSHRSAIWLAFGVCLAIGIVTIFSVGIPLLFMGLAVFGWWLASSRRRGQPIVSGRDLLWELGAFAATLLPIAVFLL